MPSIGFTYSEINVTIDSVVGEYFQGIHFALDFPFPKSWTVPSVTPGTMSSDLQSYQKYRDYNPWFISAPFLTNR